jgi:mycofactocin precursor peptide peptidase
MTQASSLSAATWTQLPERPLVLVPVGSTEQHGPHLPFDTDTVIAMSVARAAARAMSDTMAADVLVAPPVTYGASGEHQDFPGTISVGHEALRVLLIELVRSLSVWAGRIVFVNGHGGNAPTMSAVVAQMQDEQHAVDWVMCAPETSSDAHAGLDETSVMLHVAPERVDMSSAVAGDTRDLAEVLPRLIAEGVRAVTPNGILGDPRSATPQYGAMLFDELVGRVVGAVRATVRS